MNNLCALGLSAPLREIKLTYKTRPRKENENEQERIHQEHGRCRGRCGARAGLLERGGGKWNGHFRENIRVYFSWSGNTRFAAETIAKKAGAALFEIKAETSYNSDFNKCCDEAKPECYGKKLRPIKPIEGLDLAKYDVVFVGTPDWWGTMAPPVRTWVTRNKDALKGKTVCIFQTHGGGGMERVGKEFAEVVGDATKILPPKAFSGSSIKSATKALEAFVTDRLAVK